MHSKKKRGFIVKRIIVNRHTVGLRAKPEAFSGTFSSNVIPCPDLHETFNCTSQNSLTNMLSRTGKVPLYYMLTS